MDDFMTHASPNMIFGDVALFAVEVQPTSDRKSRHYTSTWASARFCFWVAGQQVGDWNDEIVLRISVSYAEDFLARSTERIKPELVDRTVTEMFRALHEDYYQIYPPSEWLSRAREIHHLDEVGNSSTRDRWGLVSVAIDEATEWFLSRSYSDPEDFLATQLPQGTIDGVLREYVAWGRDWLNLNDF